MKINLPDDVKRHVKSKVIKRLALWAILELILGSILIIWGNQIFRADSWPAFKAVICCAALAVPFAVCGVPFKLIDRTWYGIVDRVEIKTSADNEQSFKPSQEYIYSKNTIYLTVISPDTGEPVRRKVYTGMAKKQQHLESYKKSDKVFHLYGTPHTIILPSPSNTQVKCAVCGAMNDISDKENNNPVCHNCRMTLITGA